jgi:glycosyltransferase involved in cell wall biosynthesis
LERFCKILQEAHFLVLPTEFDAFGIVFCEASAYAVPSIAANVGGVSQPVREGKNGYLLMPDATAEDYAEKIKSVFADKENYLKLRMSSRQEFETRLNWEVWSEKVNKILEEIVEEHHKNNGNKQQ